MAYYELLCPKSKRKAKKTLMMKQKTLKRVAVSVIVAFLVLSMTLALCVTLFRETSSAVANSQFISLSQQDINTKKEEFYNNSVIQKLPDTVKDTDTISLIVEVKQEPLLEIYKKLDTDMSFSEYAATDEANEIRCNIQSLKGELLDDLNKTDIEYDTGSFYSSILSGFEITIKAADFKETCETFGDRARVIVSEVYNPAETKLVENEVNVYDTGIFNSSNFGYDGTGMVVAVLDTGIDYGHSAFSLDNFTADRTKLGLTFEQVSALMASHSFASERLYSGLTASDVYINEKIPFSFDYADYDPDVFPIKSDHGTHVSGIIAGKDDVITGVAPNAQLVEMKIFSDVQDTAIASWILTAVEDCVLLGVDVINMSIGTSCGFSRETDKEAMSGVYDRVREAGISLIVAASNSYNSTYGSEKNGNLGLTSNPDSGTVGSPSTYSGALSIASISGVKTPYLLHNDKIVYFIESSDKYSEEKSFLDDILPEGVDEAEIEYVTIPGVGRYADYMGYEELIKGKIALIKRGDTTFEEKANIAEEMGAAGIIIYNNVSGDIKMNVGDISIAACSIGQDDGEMLAASATGTIKISRSQTSGPFMSDFSSWGPTPDLKIKPELTAHGGSILSSVPGQGYDRISGTSMACPNIAGATALLRQYIINRFPHLAEDTPENNREIARIVNSLFMSTADIINNKNGLPYAVRKQGAGLANLDKAAATNAYIITYNKDGSAMDKAKIELGDDPSKTGVYTLNFSVYNFGSTTLTYELSAYVMTEGVSDTVTNHGQTTVTEQAVLLEGATISITSGSVSGQTLSVPAGQSADVSVTITLSDSDKAYLDQSFANGMYVEGFIVLNANEEESVDLSVPYLAFYGDWTVAPLFDLDYFETNKDELDDSISFLDKTLPDAYATRPIGGLSNDYVSYLGSYYFTQDPSATPIAADRKYISLSNQEDCVNSLRFVWAGMLRSASKIEITITDDATGEVVYSKVESDIRKSYGDGGSIYPANIKIEFSAIENNLKNNTSYTVKLKGYLDDGNDDYTDGRNGENTNLNNEFEFPLVTDFQAPVVTDCEFYTEYDNSTKKTKLFAKLAVYDNHYSMALQPGFVSYNPSDEVPFTLESFDKYLTPIYSEENSTTYVIYELTDHIYDIKATSYNKNTFTVAVYDYALNQATYEIALPDEFVDLYFNFEGESKYDSESGVLKLSPNEVFELRPAIYPGTEWTELLEYIVTVPSSGEVARVVNNKLIAVAPGTCQVIATARDPITNKQKQARFTLTVLDEGDEGYIKYDKTVAETFKLTGFYVNKAYYILDNEERDIGVTGDEMKFGGNMYSLSMFPSEAVTLRYKLDAYYPNDTEIVFKSSNENIVSVDKDGYILAKSEGLASISVNVMLDGKSTYYSQSISIEVKNPWINTGPSLTHYYGNGGTVEFPESVAVTEIGQFAFSNFDYVAKDPSKGDIINEDFPETTKIWYIGDNTIEKVIIPAGVEKIGAYAFAGLTALKEVVIPYTVTMIDQNAFYDCTSLTTISFMDENGNITTGNGLRGVKLINQSAFENTSLNGTYYLDSAVAIASYAFLNNKSLDGIILGENTVSVGNYAFANNTSLKKLEFRVNKIKLGIYAFSGCSSLEEVSVNTDVIPSGLFDGASKLESIVIGPDVAIIGEYAFRGTDLYNLEIDSANKYFSTQDKYVVNKAGDTLILVLPTVKGDFTINNSDITTIGTGAFAGNKNITSVSIPSVTKVMDYAFANCEKLENISLGTLTDIGSYAFYNTDISVLPSFESVSYIGDFAFASTPIKSVVIPDGKQVGDGAFANCLTLESVTIGNNVKIGEYAFGLMTHGNETAVKGEDGYYRYQFASPLHSLVIGNNVEIGSRAFYNASELESVTLGDGAIIGDFAFYNATKLASIDLSGVVSIGNDAFSGDVYNVFTNSSCTNMLVVDDEYVYAYYSAAFTQIDLSGVESIGEGVFAGCQNLTTVILGNNINVIPTRAFLRCSSLENIDLSNVSTIGSNAFAETNLKSVDISSATEIGEYAFAYCENLVSVIFSTQGVKLDEAAFAYCSTLDSLTNLENATCVGDFAFAYTALTQADLSGAEHIGTHAFIKTTLTEFNVTLGDKIETLGDNPFAFCKLSPFSTDTVIEFNGNQYTVPTLTYDVNEQVKVINGSLYVKVNNGLVLVCYVGENSTESVAADTVRISAYAFAGSDVKTVILPYTLKSIGHKAFFGCNKLNSVTFTSYDAPAFEEEYDFEYFYTYDNIPATGEFGFYDTDGVTEIYKEGLGIVPYFMWNVSSLPSNFYYGATFVDYIGHCDGSLTMIHPTNGQNYETFITAQYFDTYIKGAAAADEITLAAIAAIQKLPANASEITLAHKELVVAARAAYDRIMSDEQRALVSVELVDILKNAEQMIEDLEYLTGGDENSSITGNDRNKIQTALVILIVVVSVLALFVIVLAVLLFVFVRKIKNGDIKVQGAEATAIIGTATEDKSTDTEQIVSAEYEENTESEDEADEVSNEDIPEVPFEKKVFDKPVDFDDITKGYVSDGRAERRRKIILIGCAAVAAVALTVGVVIAIIKSNKSYFDAYEKEGYTISITFDSNGGTFKGSDSSIVDLYNPNNVGEDGIKLLAPDDARRDKNNIMQVTNPGYFLAGWYTERTPIDANNPEAGYTYSGKWDFENDRVLIDANAKYSAEDSVLTLYAAWVPYYNFEIYTTDESGNSYLLSTVSALSLTIPEWHEGDVTLSMDNFPTRDGYTLDPNSISYLDTMTKVEGVDDGNKKIITGEWDEATATSLTPTIKLYTEWMEGKTYRIYSVEDFIKNADTDGYYYLYADLDFSGAEWPATFLNGKFNGKIFGNGHRISNISFTSASRSSITNGLFSALGENAYIENVKFTNITHTIDLMTVAQDATFGLLAGAANDGASFENVTVSGKLVFSDNCASLAGSDSFTVKTLIGNGETTGITAGEILVEKQNNDNSSFDLIVDEDGVVSIVSGS